jgi:hypothetical protein
VSATANVSSFREAKPRGCKLNEPPCGQGRPLASSDNQPDSESSTTTDLNCLPMLWFLKWLHLFPYLIEGPIQTRTRRLLVS